MKNNSLKKAVKIGNVVIGAGNPIAIQSMTNTDTKDVSATAKQIRELFDIGCQIIRISLYDSDCANTVKEIKSLLPNIPIVGDIHFDSKIAIEAIKAGIDKIRINPGNIGNEDKVKELAIVAKQYGVPIRVGVNSGSISKKYVNLDRVSALVNSALDEIRLLEKMDFFDIVVALKSSDVLETIEANSRISKLIDYPIHLGVTDAGPFDVSIVKSSIAIGNLLLNGIGDTIRISISGDPKREVYAAKTLLRALKLRKGIEIISCPTCARTCIDVEAYANRVFDIVSSIDTDKNITIAIMGCVVNGVGEGKNATLGIAGTKLGGSIFQNGKIIGSFSKDILFYEFEKILKDLLV